MRILRANGEVIEGRLRLPGDSGLRAVPGAPVISPLIGAWIIDYGDDASSDSGHRFHSIRRGECEEQFTSSEWRALGADVRHHWPPNMTDLFTDLFEARR